MDFIGGVNRLLRINGVIRGDDDILTTFSDTQHSADIQMAQIAIQDELSEIVSERLIPYEKTSDTVTLLTATRTYALASDFIRFFGDNPSFYDSTRNVRIYEYTGGENLLKDQIYTYATDSGAPTWWYWDDTTTKKVAFFNVPDSSFNNRSLSYDYEKDVSVTNTGDTLPFHNTIEANAFIQAAARRFFFMISNQPQGLLTQDATYQNAKTRLYGLLRPTNPSKYYGHGYY
jgi:hypothetical protein